MVKSHRIMMPRRSNRSRTDTVPDVIHDAAQRSRGRRRSGIVDNSARPAKATVNKPASFAAPAHAAAMVPSPATAGPSTAAAAADAVVHVRSRPRSVPHEPARLSRRSPEHDPTPVQRSQRTSPHGGGSRPPRGPRIRSTGNGLTTRDGLTTTTMTTMTTTTMTTTTTEAPAGATALSDANDRGGDGDGDGDGDGGGGGGGGGGGIIGFDQ